MTTKIRFLEFARATAMVTMAALGLAFVLTPSLARDCLLALGLMDPLPAAATTAEALAYVDFVYGVLGAVMVGWVSAYGLLLYSSQSLDRSIIWSFGLWFVLDTTMSLATGHPRNALLNVVTIGAFLFPHIALSRSKVHPPVGGE